MGLEIGAFCDFLCSVFLPSAILGLDFLGLDRCPCPGGRYGETVYQGTDTGLLGNAFVWNCDLSALMLAGAAAVVALACAVVEPRHRAGSGPKYELHKSE